MAAVEAAAVAVPTAARDPKVVIDADPEITVFSYSVAKLCLFNVRDIPTGYSATCRQDFLDIVLDINRFSTSSAAIHVMCD